MRTLPAFESIRRWFVDDVTLRLALLALFSGLVLVACGEEENFDDPGQSDRSITEAGSNDGSGTDDDDSTDTPPLYVVNSAEGSWAGSRVSMIAYGQRPVAHMDALIEGTLARSGDCLVLDVSTGEFVHVVWPYEYSIVLDAGDAILLDENGDVVAREGDVIFMGGGNGPDPDSYIGGIAPEGCVAESYWFSGDPPQLASDRDPGAGEVETPSPDSTPRVQTPDEARESDAQMYADAFDVSLEEALWRLEMQELIAPLNPRLEQNEAHRFGGLYLQHEPEFKVVVLMTDGDEKAVRNYIDNPAIEKILEVQTVELTLSELSDIQNEVNAMLKELGIMFSSGQSVQGNRVEVHVADIDLLNAALEDAGLSLPPHVEVIEEELNSPEPDEG